jgi:PAS domain-containing protein
MSGSSHKINFKKFFLTIILPTLITIGLFVFLIFIFIIPYFEQSLLDGKKEMLRELVNSSVSIASKYQEEAAKGTISIEDAKKHAITRIENLRYGIDDKDYFWITDMQPNMVMHPYRKDLNGKDLSDFSDPNGKRLFVEMVNSIKNKEDGYVYYMWQWMDDSTKIVPKISYVKEFKQWGWIIGTGVYIEDVRNEISEIKQNLTIVLLLITGLMAALLTLIVRQNLKAEIKRNTAENELRISREKYKALVDFSTEGTGMILEGKWVYHNKKLEEILETEKIEKSSGNPDEFIEIKNDKDLNTIKEFYKSESNFLQLETVLKNGSGKSKDIILSLSKITLGESNGFIIVIKELSEDELKAKEREKFFASMQSSNLEFQKDLSEIREKTSDYLTGEIRVANQTGDLKRVFNKIPFFVNSLIESGAKTLNITNTISGFTDEITVKLAEIIIGETGKPPCGFAFVALGSEGRKEQTLLTDQDNAIIFEDVLEQDLGAVQSYFTEFGKRMSDELNEIGYQYCKGEVMAKNPKWCRPLSVWKKYFSNWISKSEPQDLLDTAIFFDLRCIYGDENFTSELTEHIHNEIGQNPVFISQAARVCMNYKTPLNMFGKIQTKSSEDHSRKINIKNPIRVIVNLARLYAMQNRIPETNTTARLNLLKEKKFISTSLYIDLIYSFDFMELLQFKTQVKAIMSGREKDNNIDLSELSGIETNTLKDVFSEISTFQSKVKFDFGIKE